MPLALARAWRRLSGLNARLVDGLIVVALAGPALLLYWRQGPLAIVLLLLLIGPLLWRRSQPFSTLLVQSAAMLATASWDRQVGQSVMAFGALLVGCYSIGVYGRHRWLSFGLVCTTALLNAAIVVVFHGSLNGFWFVQLPMFWLIGNSVREHRLRLERERDALRYAAASEERARIARDMHDVVAHSVSVMVLQAEAARKQLQRNPELAGDALQSVSAHGREALTELRHMLGLLREAEVTPSLDPQPRLADVEALVARMRRAGFEATLRIEGQRRTLAPGVDVTAYRVVQEALTNSLKHAPGATAQVLIRYDDDDLLIQVQDDGDGEPAENGTGPGGGLLGMRERVSVYGGRMQVGPLPGRGFRIQVRLPVGAGR
jgi:signal transduction histidine kinase